MQAATRVQGWSTRLSQLQRVAGQRRAQQTQNLVQSRMRLPSRTHFGLRHGGASTGCPKQTRQHFPALQRRALTSPSQIPSDLEIPAIELPGSSLAGDSKNGKITCVYFDKSGRMASKHQQLTKAEIAEQFELRHRDLRDIDLKSEGVTRILVRSNTILLQFFHLCMIIQADEALLINNSAMQGENAKDGEEIRARQQDFYRAFEQRMSGPTVETADVPELPYELRAVEAALVAVLSSLRQDFILARQKAEEAARDLRLDSGAGSMGLDLVFERTRTLSKLEQKARLVRDTIREILDADEDLAGMYLTDSLAGKPHDISDHQEAEYMLEA
jgi:magnesium transporter